MGATVAAAAIVSPSVFNRLVHNRNYSSLLHQQQSFNILPTKTKAITNVILTHLNSGRLKKAVSILFSTPLSFPSFLYSRLLQLCSSNHAIVEARKVESHLVTFSSEPPTFLLNRAIETYGKCGFLNDARELFDEMPVRDGGSWNAMITAYAQGESSEKAALLLFSRMHRSGVYANEITFASVLGSCAAVFDLQLTRQVHGLVLKYGLCCNVILGSSLVDIYGKCRVIHDARRMFDEIQYPNSVSWNVMVRRYLEMGDEKEAIIMFFKMIRANVRPMNFTFSNVLMACSCISAIKEGKQIHVVVVKIGFETDDVVTNTLIDMYTKCGSLEDAHRIFDQPGSQNVISWTSMLSGYAMCGRITEARDLFDDMKERNIVSWNAMLAGYTRLFRWEEAKDFICLLRRTTEDIDYVTLGLILNVCAGLSDVYLGKEVHGFAYRHGLYSNMFVGNALVDMYGKCGCLKNSKTWFSEMGRWRDRVSWNALITSHARHGWSGEAMNIFGEMQLETSPCEYTLSTLLAACANIFALKHGKQIHGYMLRNSYKIDVVVRGALLDMYSKCRCLKYAVKVFEETSSRDLILWNSMILGCAHNGKGREVLKLFRRMQEEGIKADSVTFQGVLLACICEGFVDLGTQYFNSMSHEYCIIPRLEHYECMFVLFSTCGCMEELEDFNQKMPFEPTVPMLKQVLYASILNRQPRMEEWAARRLNELNLLTQNNETQANHAICGKVISSTQGAFVRKSSFDFGSPYFSVSHTKDRLKEDKGKVHVRSKGRITSTIERLKCQINPRNEGYVKDVGKSVLAHKIVQQENKQPIVHVPKK